MGNNKTNEVEGTPLALSKPQRRTMHGNRQEDISLSHSMHSSIGFSSRRRTLNLPIAKSLSSGSEHNRMSSSSPLSSSYHIGTSRHPSIGAAHLRVSKRMSLSSHHSASFRRQTSVGGVLESLDKCPSDDSDEFGGSFASNSVHDSLYDRQEEEDNFDGRNDEAEEEWTNKTLFKSMSNEKQFIERIDTDTNILSERTQRILDMACDLGFLMEETPELTRDLSNDAVVDDDDVVVTTIVPTPVSSSTTTTSANEINEPLVHNINESYDRPRSTSISSTELNTASKSSRPQGRSPAVIGAAHKKIAKRLAMTKSSSVRCL